MVFIKNVFSELKQTSWLSKKELFKTTFAVVISTIALTGFIYAVDFLSTGVYGLIIKSI